MTSLYGGVQFHIHLILLHLHHQIFHYPQIQTVQTVQVQTVQVQTVQGRYIKDAATGITLGHAPCFTSELQARLEHAVLKERLGSFSFSLLDLPGYSGPVPDVKINLKHDNPIFEPGLGKPEMCRNASSRAD